MKYITEFRNQELVKNLLQQIRAINQENRTYNLMEFCGGHTHALFKFGLPQILPSNINFIHGPGCPICVLDSQTITGAINLALTHQDVILCAFGDLLRHGLGRHHRRRLDSRRTRRSVEAADRAAIRVAYFYCIHWPAGHNMLG